MERLTSTDPLLRCKVTFDHTLHICGITGDTKDYDATQFKRPIIRLCSHTFTTRVSQDQTSPCGCPAYFKHEPFEIVEGSHGEPVLSPIEKSFYIKWESHWRAPILIPQYKIGQYRVDFSQPDTRTVIELDGFLYHSSIDQLTSDRKRQRSIEYVHGWRVIRFSGQEVTKNVNSCVQTALQIILKRLERGKTDG